MSEFDQEIDFEYMSKEVHKSGPNWTQYKNKRHSAKPLSVMRRPCGSVGAAANRHYYQALFSAPDDSYFSTDGAVIANIDRKLNPKFKPKDFTFVKNYAQAQK